MADISQWECLLKNLGEWQGSFTHFSPQGELIEDTPSVLYLEGVDRNTTVRLLLRRFPPNQSPYDLELKMTSLNRSILFFENGAFSQGSLYWSIFSECGAEFSFLQEQRRLRLVLLYNANSQFKSLTLIREKLAGSNQPERPPLTVEQLIGEWQGEAVTIYPDLRPANHSSSHLIIERQADSTLYQKLTFSQDGKPHTLSSKARIDGRRLLFEESHIPRQILLLNDGASVNCPIEIKSRDHFFLEVGWLISPTQRQRLIRSYNDKGEWVSLTLVKETKV